MRHSASRSFVAVMCLLTVVGGTAVARGASNPAARTVAHRTPLSPTSGRFHALPTPTHLASYSPLSAGAHRTIIADGRAGLPVDGIEALAVTLTSASATGATQIWSGPGPSQPDVPVLATYGGARSSFAIVPVSDAGTIDVWNGAAGTGLTVDVTGWFSSASVAAANTAGLFTRLASYQVGSARLRAGATKAIPIAGVRDVPATAVMAGLLRVHASKSKSAGRLGIGSSTTAAAGVTTLAYARGSSTDLAVSALGARGKVVVQNRGAGTVTVRLDAVGVFASGTDTHVFGDALTLVDPAPMASALTIDEVGAMLTTAGIAGIPGGDAHTPPSLVLMRALAVAPTTTGGLTVDAADTSATGAVALGLRANAPSSGLLLAPTSSSGGSTIATTAGSTTVSAEAYAYFAGGTVMAPGLHVLSDAAAAAIIDLRPGSITFSGVPADLANLVDGDPISAGVTDTTPAGFIRTVTDVSTPGGNLTLQTTDAALDELYRQGDISIGAAVGKAPTVPATPRLGRRIPGGSCAINAFFIGAEVGCTAGVADPLYAASVGMGMRAELQLLLHVSWLFPSETEVFIQQSGGISVAADFRSATTTDLTFEFPLAGGNDPSAPFPAGCSFIIPAGPIEIPMPCYPGVDAEISGHITPDTDGHIEGSASFVSTIDSQTGASFEKDSSSSGDGHALGTNTDVQLQIGVGPELEWRPWGNPIAKIFVGIQGFARFTMDHCTAKGALGLQVQGGAALTVFDHYQVVNASFNHDLLNKTVFSHPVHNCAIWSGTIRSQYQLHLGDTSGIGHEQLDHVADSSLTIQPPTGDIPPVDQVYDLMGTGSGVAKDVIIDGLNCGTGEILPYARKDIYVFQGALYNVTTAALNTQILPTDDTNRRYTATILAIPYIGMHGDHRVSYTYPTDTGCQKYNPDPESADYAGGWLFSLLPLPRSSSAGQDMQFTVDGLGHASGVRRLVDNEGGSWTVTYDLQKTCTKGGSTC